MAFHMTHDDKLFVMKLEKLPVLKEQAGKWSEQIKAGGMTEELADEIHQAVHVEQEKAEEELNLGRWVMEYRQMVQRWRLNNQGHAFRH